MIRVRDVVWGVLFGIVLVLALQTYPLTQAENFVERDAKLAFLEAFQGRRMRDGTIIKLPTVSSVPVDSMAGTIDFRSLRFLAERVTWNGKHIELVARHVVGFDRMREDTNIVHEVHVKLSRDGSRFVYEHFEVRGKPPLPTPVVGNPWLPLLQPRDTEPLHDKPPVVESWD